MGLSVPARLGELEYSFPTLVLPPVPPKSNIWETSVTLHSRSRPQRGKSPSRGQDTFNLGISGRGGFPALLWVVL